MPQHDQETQAEEFYDREDATYRSFWDSSGSLHWGYFADLHEMDPESFPAACQSWTDILLAASRIGTDSHVLDVGCGNGNTAIYLAQRTGCRVTGIDISGVRIKNAQARAVPNVEFRKASASLLPFADSTFTHVWSQATLYHVPDRVQAVRELHRVLTDGGILVLDDLVTPTSSVSETGRRYVYERLLFEPGLSHGGYEELLQSTGLMILSRLDLTAHLHKSYELLAERARASSPEHTKAYLEVISAIDHDDVGWSSFVAKKVADPLEWIYGRSDDLTLREKYDAWAATYEEDLSTSYQNCPETAATCLADLVDDKDARILDVGAGTGLCGSALAKLGYCDITAVDMSDGMLRQAEQKGIYRDLARHDIEQEFPWPPGSFDAAVAAGVFTFSHAPAEALGHIVDVLRDGGIFVVTFRDDYLDSEPGIMETIGGLPLELRSKTDITIFDNEHMHIMAFQKHEE